MSWVAMRWEQVLQHSWLLPIAVVAVVMAVAVSRSSQSGAIRVPGGRSPSALIINGQALLTDESHGLLVDGVDTVFRDIEDLAFTIETGHVCLYETVGGRDLADFGLVQVAAYPRPTATLLNAIAEYLRTTRVRAVNVTGVSAPTKLFHYVRFAQAGLPVPTTMYLSHRLLSGSYEDVAEKLGLPFIIKAMAASGGRFNYLIGSEGQFLRHVQDSANVDARFLVQEFIPTETALRLLVLGGHVPIVVADASRYGCAVLMDPADIGPVVKRLAVRATSLMECDVAEIKVIQHWTTRQWYLLKATSSPAIATGAFVEDKLGAYSSYLRRRLTES